MIYKLLGFVYSFARPYKKILCIISVGVVLQVIYLLAIPLVYRIVFDKVIPQKDFSLFITLAFILIAGLLIKIVMEVMTEYAVSTVSTKIIHDIRLTLYDKLQQLTMGYLKNTESGKITSYFSNDLSSLEYALVSSTSFLSKYLLLFCFTIVTLFYFEWHLALLVLVLLPLPILITKLSSNKAGHMSINKKTEEADIIALMSEIVPAQVMVRAYNLQDFWRNKIANKMRVFIRTSIGANFYNSLVAREMILSSSAIEIVVLFASAYFAMKGYLTIGTVFGFWIFYTYLSETFAGIADTLPLLMTTSAGVERIRLFLEIPESPNEDLGEVFQELKSNIEFQHVTFGYTPEKTILKDMSFSIPPRQFVALVGPSGSGKSTILSLILKLYDFEGDIKINGLSIRNVNASTLRDKARIVLQDNLIFNLSVFDNIRLGKLDATLDDVIQAAKHAEIHEFILALPKGYDTLMGERGGVLSGGQRQRLALARALVSCPAMILLDEVTSALDPETEHEINKTLNNLMKNQTTIMVTHRLYSVIAADRILVLDKGQLAESGTHDELLAKQGLYATLWEKQHGISMTADGEIDIKLSYLRKIPLLQETSDEFLLHLSEHFVSENFEANQVIIKQGESGHKFYLIVSGTVEVIKESDGGQEEVIATLEDGDYFGEIALIKDVPRTATVKAKTHCLLLVLYREQFTRMIKDDPLLRQKLEDKMQSLSNDT